MRTLFVFFALAPLFLAAQLVSDGDFENLPAGELAGGIHGAWTVPEGAGTAIAVTILKDAAHDGAQGLRLARQSEPAKLTQTVELNAGLFELTAWARGKGHLRLQVGNDRRRLLLADDWQPCSLVFMRQDAGPAVVTIVAESQADIDDVAIVAAPADRQEAWRRQEEARQMLGFVPATASAQRPAPGVDVVPWTMPEGTLAWRRKAVYYDARYSVAHIKNPDALATYLGAAGFEILDAEMVADWMAEQLVGDPYGTVLVMPLGAAPASIYTGGEDTPLIRYLHAGGRILWCGDVPLYYWQTETSSLNGNERWAGDLGIRGGWNTRAWGNHGVTPEVTGLGERWGLTQAGGSIIAAFVSDITAPLSTFFAPDADADLAVCWFKNFAPEKPWSGFIFALRSTDLANPAIQQEAYRLALYAGTPVEAPVIDISTLDIGLPVKLALTPGAQLPRTAFYRGETIPLQVAVHGAAERLQLTFSSGGDVLASGAFPARGAVDWTIDSTDLAAADYLLRAEAWDGDRLVGYAEETVSVCPKPPDPTFFYGAWPPYADNPYRVRLAIETMAANHLQLGCVSAPGPMLDAAMRYGLRAGIRVHGDARGPFEDGSQRLAPNGEPYPSAWGGGRPLNSLASPRYREAVAKSMREVLEQLAPYPVIWPYAHTNDDFSQNYGPDNSPLAKELFRRLHGMEPPVSQELVDMGLRARGQIAPPSRPPGIVPEDDPWLHWGIFTTRDVGGGFNAAQMAACREIMPNIKLGPVPGGMQMPLWVAGQYPPHDFGGNAFNLPQYYYYLNFWQPSIGAVLMDGYARLNNRDSEVWVVPGICLRDEPTYYRNMFYLHLAGGANGLNYFTMRDGMQRPHGLAELGRLGAEVVAPYFPLLGELRPERHRVGLLIPYTHSLFEMGYPFQAVYVFANLAGAKIDAEPTCEEELMSGDAGKTYDVILLWHVKWLRQAAFDALEAFIAKGGKVLVDASTEIDVPGAVKLDVDLAMGRDGKSVVNSEDLRFGYPGISDYLKPDRVAAIREALLPYARPAVDSPAADLLVRSAAAGGTRYLWLVQLHTYDDYMYVRPRVGAGARPEDPEKATAEYVDYMAKRVADYGGDYTAPVSVAVAGSPVVYDVLRGRPVTAEKRDGRLHFTAAMTPFGGQLVALYDRPPASLTVTVPEVLERGTPASVRVEARDAAGKPVPGVHPLRLTVAHGSDTFREWTGSYLLRDGVFELPLRPARNHPTGAWRLTAEELSTGQRQTVQFRVR